MLFIHLLFGGVGLLLAGLGIPLWREKIGPNGLYGFRVSATLKDRRVWFAVNRVLGMDMFVLGSLQLVAAGIGYALWPKDGGARDIGRAAWLQLGVFAVGFAITIIHCVLVLRRVRGQAQQR